ncbi:CRISPR-associated endonuclease Cas1 [Candidatus Bathyarchaeota archaeon]|nr:CRISPR-associated endonuclease Cas1 [Candidatus Bathyarchaeota archaeon]
MTMLFLDDFGIFLGRKRNRFVVKKDGERREFVADKVDSIICTCSGVAFSSSALSLAVENHIQVVFARFSGWPYAVLMPTALTGSVRARREQFLAYNDVRGFMLAKGFVKGKLRNQASLLKLLAKNRKPSDPKVAEALYAAGKAVDAVVAVVEDERAENIDVARQRLMNLEAEAARIYWDAVGRILPAELEFKGRVTRGATDPFNVMLNFGYQAVLFPEVWKAVCYAGLDPYAGFLHADRPGKPSLVLDLMEEFRQQLVDRALIGLVSKRIIKPEEIMAEEDVEKNRLLSKKAAEQLLESLLERFEAKVMFAGKRNPLKSFIYHQARAIVRFLLGDSGDYVPFVLGW